MSAIFREFTASEAAIKRLLARYFRKTQDVEDCAPESFLRAYAAEAKRTILLPKADAFDVAKHVALENWIAFGDNLGSEGTLTAFYGDPPTIAATLNFEFQTSHKRPAVSPEA